MRNEYRRDIRRLLYPPYLRSHIAAELRSCAETIAATDARMLGIRKRIEQMQETESGGAEPQGTGSQGTESQEKVL